MTGLTPMPSRTATQPITAGLVAAFVGFASSFAVVLKGLAAVGATEAQAASGLMALSVAMGIAGIVFSVGLCMPVFVAWSTPGAALLAATGSTPGGFPAAVGSFVVVGILLIEAPIGATLIVLSWLVASRWKRIYATPGAALVAGLVIAVSGRAAGFDLQTITPRPEFVAPTFTL